MKIFLFKFHQNRTITKNYFFEDGAIGKGPPFLNFIIGNNMKMMCYKFQQNRTINEQFDFFEGREGLPCPQKSQIVHLFTVRF